MDNFKNPLKNNAKLLTGGLVGAHNKRFKRDSQRTAFLLCVGFGDYGVMQKVSSSVVCPLSGR